MDFIENVDIVDVIEIINVVDVRVPRQHFQRTNFFESLTEEEFFRRFRLRKMTVMYILENIENKLEFWHNRNNSISPVNQLLLTLRTFATGGHQIAIGDFMNCDRSTVSRIVSKVSRAIANLAPKFIYMPRNATEVANQQNKFFEIAGFPKVIGAIDGTHIRILSQGGIDAEVFRNRKGYFSVNVQAVASADLHFQDIVARWPGSTHDSFIFNSSRLKNSFKSGVFGNGLLLGDSAYVNSAYLVTPFPHPQDEGERKYNFSHTRSRVKVENLFGVWKRRFPIMGYGCRMKLKNILPSIVATAVLHNIAQLHNEPEPPVDNEIWNHNMQNILRQGNIDEPIIYDNNQYDNRRHLVNTYFMHL